MKALTTLTLALCLLGAAAHAQTTPPAGLTPPDHWYVNGKPSTKAAVEALDPKTIKRMDTYTGKQAVAHSHDASSKKVVMVTTK